MNLIKKFDKKFAIAIVIALFFGFLTIYEIFIRQSKPELSIDILSNATVFDIKEKIGNLDVIYDSASLTKQNKTLSIMTLKIANSGNESILKENFDTRFPLKLIIDSTKIVQLPKIIESNENYLFQSIRFEIKFRRSCQRLSGVIRNDREGYETI